MLRTVKSISIWREPAAASHTEHKISVNRSDVTLKKLPRKTADHEIKLFDVVSSNTSLRQCVESNVGILRRGCAF